MSFASTIWMTEDALPVHGADGGDLRGHAAERVNWQGKGIVMMAPPIRCTCYPPTHGGSGYVCDEMLSHSVERDISPLNAAQRAHSEEDAWHAE